MKKKVIALLSLCLIPIVAMALIVDSKISTFYGTYLEPIGNGRAKEFLGQNNFINGIEIGIEKTDIQTLRITYGSEVQEITNLPQSLFEMKEASWENFNINVSRQSLFLQLDKFEGKTQTSSSSLQNLIVKCLITNRNRGNDYDILIENCTKQGSLKLSSFVDINKRKDSFISVFFYRSLKSTLASQTKISNLVLNINNHKFKMTAKITSGMSAKVKVAGRVSYQSSNKVLKIRLDKAKAGIISLKGRIFNELEASNDPNIRIVRPYIYITLKK